MRLLAVAFVSAIAVACGGTPIVLGDDTTVGPSEPEEAVFSDAAPPDAPSTADATPLTTPPPEAGTDAPDDVTCPTLSPPAPSFCDGATPVAKYDSKGCVVGYGCAPLDCTSAGGQCVAIVPGSCPSNSFGDANKYSCGGGLGVGCCLP